MTDRAAPIDLLFVIAPHSLLLDIAGPAEAFRLANLHRALRRPAAAVSPALRRALDRRSTPPSGCRSPSSSPCRAPELADLGGARRPAERARERGDAGDRRHRAVAEPHAARPCCETRTRRIAWSRSARATLLAARAGLLDNRRCTTHHELLDALRELAPRRAGGGQPRVRGRWAGGLQRRHHRGHRSRAAPDRRRVWRGAGGQRRGGHGGVPAALAARPRAVAVSRAPPPHARRRAPGAGRHRAPSRNATGTWPRWPRWATSPSATCCGCSCDHAGVSPLHYLQAIRLERARQSLEHGASVTRRRGGGGLSLGPAPAPRVEPAMGRLAARRAARGARFSCWAPSYTTCSVPVVGWTFESIRRSTTWRSTTPWPAWP